MLRPTAAAANGRSTMLPSSSSLERTNSSYSHAVSRSAELLSCARTALKVLQGSPVTPQTQWLMTIEPHQLQLHDCSTSTMTSSHRSEVDAILQDGLFLLNEMQLGVRKLQGLVRRRGHTNDPTDEIARAMQQWESDAKELANLVPTLLVGSTGHYRKHLEFVVAWLQKVASQQTKQVKDTMKLRSNVLADQAQRRKLLNPSMSSNTTTKTTMSSSSSLQPSSNMSGATATPWDSPLFTLTTQPISGIKKNGTRKPRIPTAAATRNTSTMTSRVGGGTSVAGGNGYSGAYGGGGGGYGVGGYGGGGYGGSGGMGMRQRRSSMTPSSSNNNSTTTHDNDTNKDAMQVQMQIQERQKERQTHSRLESARQAERTLADLGTLFGKMSSLIVQQGEVLEKVEDDVEVALGDVTAGQEEITKLYSLKKGNRALILKVFAILIFFILFMRLY